MGGSPGRGLQQFANRTNTSSSPLILMANLAFDFLAASLNIFRSKDGFSVSFFTWSSGISFSITCRGETNPYPTATKSPITSLCPICVAAFKSCPDDSTFAKLKCCFRKAFSSRTLPSSVPRARSSTRIKFLILALALEDCTNDNHCLNTRHS